VTPIDWRSGRQRADVDDSAGENLSEMPLVDSVCEQLRAARVTVRIADDLLATAAN